MDVRLPLSLQDLCLLEAINDLDSYPVELLSSLPHWLRHRLFNNLPVLDLCRLGHTPVAIGVDTEKIWRSLALAVPTIFYDEKNPRVRPSVTRDILHKERALDQRYGHQPFVLDRHFIEQVDKFITKPVDIPALGPGLVAAFSAIPDRVFNEGVVLKCGYVTPMVIGAQELCLLKAAFHLLDRLKWMDCDSESYVGEYKVVYEWMISINYYESVEVDGDSVSKRGSEPLKECAKNGQSSGARAEEEDSTDGSQQRLQWISQATAVAKYCGVYGDIQLAPHRLLQQIYAREDPLELFSLLSAGDCSVRPSQIVLNHALLAKNVNLVFPDVDRCEKFIRLLKDFLQNIQNLGLRSEERAVDHECEMHRAIVEGVVGSGKNCCLKVFFWNEPRTGIDIGALSPSLCTLPCDPEPPRYQSLSALELICFSGLGESLPYLTALLKQQIVLKVAKLVLSFKDSSSSDVRELFNTLGLLFSRPHFQALTIDHSIESSIYSLLILRGFLMSPCPHEQQLSYDISLYSPVPPKITSESVDLGGETILQCAVDHKTFLTDTSEVFKQLLCFPCVRLKQLNLQLDNIATEVADNSQLHSAALHPDLQVTNLRIEIGDDLSATACDDMRVLLQMPTLRKLIITGEYSSVSVPLLTQGLKEQAKIGSLRFLTFDSDTEVWCGKHEFVELFDVVFSLSQLSDLKLTFSGYHLLETIEGNQQEIYENWKCTASGRQFKCIEFIGFDNESKERDFSLLSKIALSSEIIINQ